MASPEDKPAPTTQAAPPEHGPAKIGDFAAVESSPGYVAMRKPDGSIVEVPKAHDPLEAAARRGYAPATPAEVYRKREGVAGELLTEAAAGLRGATFGFSDPALVATARAVKGDAKAEDVRRELNVQKEAYPATASLGEVGGVLASTLMLPGAAPGAGVGRMALRAGVEGAAIGAGDYASRITLSNEDFSAEALAGHMVKYGALGAALGGGLGAAGKVAGRLASRAERAEGLASKLGNPVDRIAMKGEDLAQIAGARVASPMEAEGVRLGLAGRAGDRASELYAKLAGRLGIAEEGAVRTFTRLDEVGSKARKLIVDEGSVLAEAQAAGTKALESIAEHSGIPKELVNARVKASLAEPLVRADNAAEVANVVGAHVERAKATAMAVRGVGLTKEAVELERAALHASSLAPNLEAASSAATNAKAYEGLDILKRTAREVETLAATARRGAMPLDQAALDAAKAQVRELSTGLRVALEDTNVWGRMGEAQKNLNSNYGRLIDSRRDFERAFMTETMGRKVVDPSKVDRYIKKGPGANIQAEAVRAYVDSTEKMASDVLKYASPSAAQRKGLEAQIRATKEWRRVLSVAEERAQAVEQYKALGKVAGAGIDKAALVGWLVGGAGGAAAGKVASALANPRTVVDVMARAEAAKRIVSERYAAAIGRMAEGKAAKAVDMGVELTDAQMTRLQELSRNPAELNAAVESWSKSLFERAPELGTKVMVSAARMTTWLATNLPKVTPQPSVLPSGREIPPSQDEVERSRRKLQILFNPEAAGDLVAASRMMPEHVATLRSVYPEHYAELRAQIAYLTAARRPNLSVQQEMSLKLFFDTPGNTMFEPMAVQQYQAVYQKPAPPPPTGAGARMPIKGTRRLATEADERDK